MDRLETLAAAWGLALDYVDAHGRSQKVGKPTLHKVLDALGTPPEEPDANARPSPATATRAYQGAPTAPWRMWIIAVQLYAVRSRRNWGHGDFTDLSDLIELAAETGAAGIGLNPLHVLFDDAPEQASPYSPNSRLFLNPLYIDIGAVEDFSSSAELPDAVVELRAKDRVDYAGVASVKYPALRQAHRNFRRAATAARKSEFEAFRQRHGSMLARFAAFETLRRRHGNEWRKWPEEWRIPDDDHLAKLRADAAEETEFHEYLQWVAETQLAACRDKAARLGLPIGLYLDLAVGVDPNGADAWADQAAMLTGLSVGAPPDLLNTAGQNWGLTGYNPVALKASGFEPFRRMLAAAMRHSGAVRIDHVLGLNRLYVIPEGASAREGAYLHFPFEALLSAVAEESHRYGCIVIGEDLGTVPGILRVKLHEWGIWSYRVMLFERAADGRFLSPSDYPENALVCFSTHDLPAFSGWLSGHDLGVKRSLSLDPGESDSDRAAAHAALKAALEAHAMSAGERPNFLSVVEYLTVTPCRLLAISLEDILGMVDQTNVPGTVREHPNWRRRMPIDLEDLGRDENLRALSEIANVHRDSRRTAAG